MQVANGYERAVFNDDLVVITELDVAEARLTVSFEGRNVICGFTELNELAITYATGIRDAWEA